MQDLVTAVGKVSLALKNLLAEEMGNNCKVTLRPPKVMGGSETRINLFLYRVDENAALKNMEWHIKPGDPPKQAPPPLSLNLFYIMSAYAPVDDLTEEAAVHDVLAQAMRVLYDNPLLPANRREEHELTGSREQIQIVLCHSNIEELSQLWNTFGEPFRLSVLYEVSVVQVDSARDEPATEPVREVRLAPLDADYRPPVVHGMLPVSGPTGTTITFRGEYLAGRKAIVTAMGESTEVKNLPQDSFSVTLPDSALPGFYEVKVDISGLFSRAFLFEVPEEEEPA